MARLCAGYPGLRYDGGAFPPSSSSVVGSAVVAQSCSLRFGVVAPVLWWALCCGGSALLSSVWLGGLPHGGSSPALSSIWWAVCDGSR